MTYPVQIYVMISPRYEHTTRACKLLMLCMLGQLWPGLLACSCKPERASSTRIRIYLLIAPSYGHTTRACRQLVFFQAGSALARSAGLCLWGGASKQARLQIQFGQTGDNDMWWLHQGMHTTRSFRLLMFFKLGQHWPGLLACELDQASSTPLIGQSVW